MATQAAPAHPKVPVPWLSIAMIAAAVALCLLAVATALALLRRETPRTPDDVSSETIPEQADEAPSAPLAAPPDEEQSVSLPAVPPPALADAAIGSTDAAATDATATDAALDGAVPDAAPPDAAPTDEVAVAPDEELAPEAVAESGPQCGAVVCPAGMVCCNASCGTCTYPGELCSQLVCGMPIVPSSTPCGPSTCDIGEICCNSSCGTCVRFGEKCDSTRRCFNEITYPRSEFCGMQTCNVGYVCCNPSCGICKRPGEPCRQDTCG